METDRLERVLKLSVLLLAILVGFGCDCHRICHSIEPPPQSRTPLEDKLVMAPIVVQGKMISRSNVYNSLYFVSFRILKVLKGKLPRKLRRHIRLLFHSQLQPHLDMRPRCRFPVTFQVRSSKKYLVFIRRLAPARFVAVAKPEIVTKDVKRATKRTLCVGCGK